MQHVRWTALVLVGLGGLWTLASSPVPVAPALLGRSLGADVAPLEARVSARPDDAAALALLLDRYLDAAAPGLAQAALERAPQALREQPEIADARARTLWQLGAVGTALEVQRRMLAACAEPSCSPALVARAQRRERLLSELARRGVEDPRAAPAESALAYRVSMREVSLDVGTP
jgi:hypothetical protein